MNKQDEQKFKELITVIGETYGQKFSEAQIKLWWNLFKPHSIQEFEQAVYQHISCPDAGMFTPKPANLMKFINGTSKQQEQAVEDKAEMSWNVILGEMSRIGSYGTLKLDDRQALAAVAAVGGWKKICSQTHDQLVWVKKEFISCYQNYERTPLEALPNNLPGRIELDKHKSEAKDGMKSLAEGVNSYREKLETKGDQS